MAGHMLLYVIHSKMWPLNLLFSFVVVDVCVFSLLFLLSKYLFISHVGGVVGGIAGSMW